LAFLIESHTNSFPVEFRSAYRGPALILLVKD
jgi:hypothetical protein